MRLRLLSVLLLAWLGLRGEAPARPVLRPFKTSTPPVLDGVLDDAVWAQARSVTDFVTFIPEFGKTQAERTVAYMAYDEQNLYFAFRCFDDQPGKIKAALSRRDDIATSDFVCINLDTFNDQQSLYAFYVTPTGVQGDSRFASNKEDFSVDLVWDSAARMDAEGYTVEIRIPLKSIRYLHRPTVQMAVFFERTINRRQEHGSFPALDPARGYAFLPQMAVLEYEGLARPTLLELLPAFTLSRRATREEGVMVRHPDDRQWSLTGKYGLTPSLILDATVNPDFSQVEADAGQVDANLRSGLFFAEKRPFFLEGSEAFNIAASQSGPLAAVLHTRTIVDPKWGAKLSGKLGQNDTLAALSALDTADPASGAADPRFSILRYRRSTQEDGYLGAFYAAREQDARRNRVLGPDGQIRLSPGSQLGFHAFGSSTRDTDSAAVRQGRALGLEYLYDTSRLTVNADAHDITTDFVADAGYLTRTGLSSANLRLTPKLYPASSWARRLDPFVGYATLRDHPSGLREGDATFGLTTIFQGNGSATLQWDDATEVFLGQRFRTDGLRMSAKSQVHKTLSLQGSYWRGKGIRYTADPFQGHGSQTSFATVYQPGESLNLTLNWTYADFYREATGERIYAYPISRARLTYQFTQAFFLRAIVEYNGYRRQLLTDLLASYTYIPGTVIYLGYGSLAKKQEWENGQYRPSEHYLDMQRGLFFKASYLWRY